jgi:hypothetical protein
LFSRLPIPILVPSPALKHRLVGYSVHYLGELVVSGSFLLQAARHAAFNMSNDNECEKEIVKPAV